MRAAMSFKDNGFGTMSLTLFIQRRAALIQSNKQHVNETDDLMLITRTGDGNRTHATCPGKKENACVVSCESKTSAMFKICEMFQVRCSETVGRVEKQKTDVHRRLGAKKHFRVNGLYGTISYS